MDLVTFFRTAIAVIFALFCGAVVFSIVGLFAGNTYFILRNFFKKEKNTIEISEIRGADKGLAVEKDKEFDRTLPKAI